MGIQRARPEDIDGIVRTLHEAFRHDPVSNWVFPDEAAIEELHPVPNGWRKKLRNYLCLKNHEASWLQKSDKQMQRLENI